MTLSIRSALLSLAVILPGAADAADKAGDAPRPQSISLRVVVDAAGKVQSATPIDSSLLPALNQAAGEVARKLTFTPARKDGRAVASETTLSERRGCPPWQGRRAAIRPACTRCRVLDSRRRTGAHSLRSAGEIAPRG